MEEPPAGNEWAKAVNILTSPTFIQRNITTLEDSIAWLTMLAEGIEEQPNRINLQATQLVGLAIMAAQATMKQYIESQGQIEVTENFRFHVATLARKSDVYKRD